MNQHNLKIINMIIYYVIMIIFTFIFVFPTLFLIISSIKNDEYQIIADMSSIKAFLPIGDIGFQNYQDVFGRMPFWRFFWNSVFITTVAVGLGVIVNSMMAYALARIPFKGSKLLLTLIISLIIIPIESVIVPMLLLVNRMGIIDTYTVQIIPFLADAFIIYLFYQYFLGIPTTLDEAAKIDGASRYKIYWQIILPLSGPVIASTFILNSLGRWGDVLWPKMVTRGEEFRPLPLAMQQLFTLHPRMWGDIFAFATLTVLPILFIYLAFQKKFIESIASTGVKG